MSSSDAVEKTREIQKLRRTISLVSDAPQPLPLHKSFTSALRRGVAVFRALACIRFALSRPIRMDWCVVFDGGRSPKKQTESEYDFLDRIGRTNRSKNLPSLLSINSNNTIVLVDMAQTATCKNGAYGTLPFLFALSGLNGVPKLMANLLGGMVLFRSPQSALIFAALKMIESRSENFQNGLLMTTSISWLAEVLRVGLSGARPAPFGVVEVLHGAGSKNTSEYFHWVHGVSCASMSYINLIADLPRYAPLDQHLLRDEQGEIASNIRLWQGLEGRAIETSWKNFLEHNVVFVGGMSINDDYSKTSFFKKELDLIKALSLRGINVSYCIHPVHKGEVADTVLNHVAQSGGIPFEGTTLEALIAASVVVGGLSTSLLEAALLGNPTFAYEDMGEIFIAEIAEMVVWDTDIIQLSGQIEQEFSKVSDVPKSDILEVRKNFCQTRFGLKFDFPIVEETF